MKSEMAPPDVRCCGCCMYGVCGAAGEVGDTKCHIGCAGATIWGPSAIVDLILSCVRPFDEGDVDARISFSGSMACIVGYLIGKRE